MEVIDQQHGQIKSSDRLDAPIRAEYHELQQLSNVVWDGFHLPGYGMWLIWPNECGTVKFLTVGSVCQNVGYKLHHCDNKECPRCSNVWATKRARAATQRLEAAYSLMWNKYRPSHRVLSVPEELYGLPYYDWKDRVHGKKRLKVMRGLKSRANAILRKYARGFYGGAIVFHPWRFRDNQGREVQWKHCSINPRAEEPVVESFATYSPHFHYIGYGWIAPELYDHTGWVHADLGRRPTYADTQQTIYYLLTHAGVDKKHQAVRWLGRLGTNQLLRSNPRRMKLPVMCECGNPECVVQTFDFWGWYAGDLSILVTKYHYRFKGEPYA